MDHSSIEELIVLSLCGALNREQEERLNRWIAESDENRAFFDRIKQQSLYTQHKEEVQQVNTEKAIRNFDRKTGGRVRSVRRRYRYTALVASVLLLMGIYVFVQHNRQERALEFSSVLPPSDSKPVLLILDDGTRLELHAEAADEIDLEGVDVGRNELVYKEATPGEKVYNTLYVPRGGEYRVTLSDGTVVRLNSGTTFRYPVVFDGDLREVYLDGEAYFSVKASPEVPFAVMAGGLCVKAYGTEFNINSHSENRTETALVRGSVGISVKGAEGELLLAPLQVAVFDKQTQAIVIKDTDIAPYIAWTEGIFIFENKRLEEILEVLSLWYDQDIICQQPEIKELHFTGMVKRFDSIDSILKAILGTINVVYEHTGEQLILKFASPDQTR